MKTTVIKNAFGLGISLLFLCIIYLFFTSLSHRQHSLYIQATHLKTLLDQQTQQLNTLQKSLNHIHQVLLTEKHILPEEIGHVLEEAAREYRLEQMHYTSLPGQALFEKHKVQIKKIPIHVSFIVKSDDNLWLFIKNIHKIFPGIVISQMLSLEKIQDNEGPALKGSYHFQWHSLHSSSKGS